MQVYTGILMGLTIVAIFFASEARDSKTSFLGFLIYLPIYGRIFGWW